jgi:D-aminopeptidase
LGGWTVGVLVQSNYGGVLSIAGAPVGRELGQYYLQGMGGGGGGGAGGDTSSDFADGSIMMVVATDAPLSSRNLKRLARRALAGLARTGSSMTNGSGDYVIAFSTVRVADMASRAPVANDDMSPLFEAVIEATEEAIYNSLFTAETVHGHRGTAEALPVDSAMTVLRRHGVVR